MKVFFSAVAACLFLLGTRSCMAQQTPATATEDGGWHIDVTPYLWFPGVHGTVGALRHDVIVQASPIDLLSHFNIGLMGAADARYKRFVLNGNLQWVRLSDSQAVPLDIIGITSADTRVGQLVLTPKVGYRFIDEEKLKAEGLIGVRYWHLGQKFELNLVSPGFTFEASQNWADILIGGRIQIPVAKKVGVNLMGDVGGWNATAKLDYSFAALLSYKFRTKWTMLAGYNYQFVDYRGGNSSVFKVVMSGAVLAMTYHLR